MGNKIIKTKNPNTFLSEKIKERLLLAARLDRDKLFGEYNASYKGYDEETAQDF